MRTVLCPRYVLIFFSNNFDLIFDWLKSYFIVVTFIAGHLGGYTTKSLSTTYLSYSSDGRFLLANMGGENIYLYDTENNISPIKYPTPGLPLSLATNFLSAVFRGEGFLTNSTFERSDGDDSEVVRNGGDDSDVVRNDDGGDFIYLILITNICPQNN